MRDEELYLKGYRLTTLEIVYHNPDFYDLLQIFIWQSLDLAPKFPRSHKFIEFWKREIVGELHSVKVAQALHLNDFTKADVHFDLH